MFIVNKKSYTWRLASTGIPRNKNKYQIINQHPENTLRKLVEYIVEEILGVLSYPTLAYLHKKWAEMVTSLAGFKVAQLHCCVFVTISLFGHVSFVCLQVSSSYLSTFLTLTSLFSTYLWAHCSQIIGFRYNYTLPVVKCCRVEVHGSNGLVITTLASNLCFIF